MRGRAWLLVALAGCPTPITTTLGPPAPEPPLRRAVEELTILYTADEHGWVEPTVGEVRRGGVSQLLAHLIRDESHCAGAFPESPLPDCRESHTVLLSGGDNYTGPAISSHFHGETMASAMRRLGYAAAAFGNHELDFGREQFEANRAIGGFPYLAANLRKEDGSPHELVKGHVIVERGHLRIGVLGISTADTPKTATAHRFIGMRFDPPEPTLAREVPALWDEGVDAVVVLAHECHDIIAPIVAAHPEWRLAFVGTGHCHRTAVEYVHGTPVIGPDWRLEHYARVRLAIDKDKPAKERATAVDWELMEVASPAHEPAPTVDAELDKRIASWDEAVDAALGEIIGYSAVGLAKGSGALGRWIVDAWRKRFAADVAITTRGSIRQELPPGPITMATVASIMPFENELVICTVTGADLATMLASPEVIATPLDAIDPAKRYRVVTTDFLFHGGDGMAFHQLDAAPFLTGVNWRVPVIEWTKSAASTKKKPIEAFLLTGS
jgi:5'-nucleotidase/UDP-sugar diphosphatase